MLTIIPGPADCCTTTILLADIVRTEMHSSTLLGEEAHSLYVFVRQEEETEYFYLFSYPQQHEMKAAHQQVMQLLQTKPAPDHAIQICHAAAVLGDVMS